MRVDSCKERPVIELLRLPRLASDTGAHRCELSSLRLDDLHDRLLTVERGARAEIISTALSSPVGRTGADGAPGSRRTLCGWAIDNRPGR